MMGNEGDHTVHGKQWATANGLRKMDTRAAALNATYPGCNLYLVGGDCRSAVLG